MFASLAKKIFGSANDRRLKSYQPKVVAINALEKEIEILSDDELRSRTDLFKQQIAEGKQLDELLVPAFATVREAAKRTLGQRHFDVQLIGGMVLHESGISEMRTGEGKTLVATLPVYLNALTGKGVHVVTVNDYLASRDAEWMGQIYNFLGLSVGVIVHGLDDRERKEAYGCDITYGTNNEFGFDYLRDNMKYDFEEMVQREHHYAIVDEVDSILIDEARTPLIISGPIEDRSELYTAIDQLIPRLTDVKDYERDEKQRAVSLTEEGNEKIEDLLRELDLLKEGALYDAHNATLVHHVNQALRAHTLFQRDKDYIVRNDEVVIIDEFTGRMMPGRRYSEGLHQALEAKERVQIQPENQTLASITFQNYFRLYEKLGGMTGTAATEADEFMDIYNLNVIEIPTNMPVARIDEHDEIYRTADEKFQAILTEIKECSARYQPILVGTTSIENSETLGDMLKKEGFKLIDFSDSKGLNALYSAAREGRSAKAFAILNARFHEQEAFIVAQAGVPGAITIATNMAGRGTDIQLGGNAKMRILRELADIPAGPEREEREQNIIQETEIFKKKALEAGGLYVLGTERHESRRIDNQMRGRSGRQGDPGRSKFYLSLEDDLMRIFGSERMDAMLQRFGLPPGEAIIHPWINKAIEQAQAKVEARNFDMRKNILKYDNVMNDQRKVVFEQRREFMSAENVHEIISEMRHGVVEDLLEDYMPPEAFPEQWKTVELKEDVLKYFNLDLPVVEWAQEEGIGHDQMEERLLKAVNEEYEQRIAKNTPNVMVQVEKQFLLQTLDHLWREHLVTLDHLRQVIGWRGFAQRDPLNEYKSEAFELFNDLITRLRQQVTGQLMRVEVVFQSPEEEQAFTENAEFYHQGIPSADMIGLPSEEEVSPAERDPKNPNTWGRVGRNEPCPCGSGKKYKHCHGRLS